MATGGQLGADIAMGTQAAAGMVQSGMDGQYGNMVT